MVVGGGAGLGAQGKLNLGAASCHLDQAGGPPGSGTAMPWAAKGTNYQDAQEPGQKLDKYSNVAPVREDAARPKANIRAMALA